MRQYTFFGAVACTTMIALVSVLGVPAAAQETAVADAVSYLQSKSPSAWSIMALAAANESPSTSHLKDTSGDSAINYTAPILALTAADKDPRSYPDTDLVKELLSYHQSGQLGDPTLVNDDVFGILALVSAGEANHAAVADARSFVLDNQKSNGSWGYSTSGSGDTNTTAAAVMALMATGMSEDAQAISDALSFLRGAQNDDGGFPYDPNSSFSTASDASSDAWVLALINVLGDDLSGWEKNGTSPREHLLTLQADEGYFKNQSSSDETSFTPTETSYAVIALAGEGFPIGVVDEDTDEDESNDDEGDTGDDNDDETDDDNNSDDDQEFLDPSVMFQIEGPSDTVCDGTVRAKTALAVIENAADDCGYSYDIEQTDFGPYLKSIAGHEAQGSTGWMYTVNWQPASSISVGAGDYGLDENDHVLWLFDTFENIDDRVEDLRGATDSVPLEVTISGDGDDEDKDEDEDDDDSMISFQVTDPDGGSPSFTFEDVERGQNITETVVLHNEGTVALRAASNVTGDSLFREYLNIAGDLWRSFSTVIGFGQSQETELSLTVPTDFEQSGTMEGTLVFWVTPE